MKENVVCSKLEAGNWAKKVMPQKYRRIVEDAVNVYTNKLSQMKYSKDILKDYANYMSKEIKVYK